MGTRIATNHAYELMVLLAQAALAVGRVREDELRQYGISRMQGAVLFILKAVTVPATPAEISRWLFREPHTVSGLLDRMEKKGLIRKVKDLERKNLIRIVMTDKGEEDYRRSREMKTVRKTLSCLSDKDRDNLMAYLRKLRDKAVEELGGGHQLPFP